MRRYRHEIDNVRSHLRTLWAVIAIQVAVIGAAWYGWLQAPEDGAVDYGAAIFLISPYLTPRYRAVLLAELEGKSRQGELAYRERGLQEIPGHGYEERRVDVLGNGAWIVWLDLDLLESVKGMTVKRTAIRYPLRVVRYGVLDRR